MVTAVIDWDIEQALPRLLEPGEQRLLRRCFGLGDVAPLEQLRRGPAVQRRLGRALRKLRAAAIADS